MQLIDNDIVLGEGIFDAQELKKVIEICEKELSKTGCPDTTDLDCSTLSYDSFSGFIKKNPETKFMFERFAKYAKNINDTYFQLDLTAVMPKGFLFTKYDTPGGHLGWHTDKKEHSKTVGTEIPNTIRKMAIALQLSDPSEYKGCDMQIIADQGLKEIPKKKGSFYCIPGYVQHQITPLISGKRIVLIAWYVGPKFK